MSKNETHYIYGAGMVNLLVFLSSYPPNLRALGGIYIFMGSSQGGYPSVRGDKKNALSDVVGIMGFNFGHVTPILRKTEKCQKKANHEGGTSFVFDPSNR